MKRISKYFLCLFAVVLTAGCAEDKLSETEFDPTVYEGDKAYMTVPVSYTHLDVYKRQVAHTDMIVTGFQINGDCDLIVLVIFSQ